MIHETNIRVRYAETDKMGFVYYGNYATYFEVGRVEFLRSKGYSYKQLEDEGVMMPVVEINIKYKRPAIYDDLLVIKTSIKEMTSKRVLFNQEVYKDDKVLSEGTVELAFIDSISMRPIACPSSLESLFSTLLYNG